MKGMNWYRMEQKMKRRMNNNKRVLGKIEIFIICILNFACALQFVNLLVFFIINVNCFNSLMHNVPKWSDTL